MRIQILTEDLCHALTGPHNIGRIYRLVRGNQYKLTGFKLVGSLRNIART